jgi:hypothetical protein
MPTTSRASSVECNCKFGGHNENVKTRKASDVRGLDGDDRGSLAEATILDCGLRTVVWRAALLAMLACACARAEVAQVRGLADPSLARKLSQRVTFAWQGQSLGAALERLAEIHELPLWIDRRVDVGAKVDLTVDDLPLAEALDHIASSRRGEPLGWSTLANVVYVGPRQAALELATSSTLVRQALAKAPADIRQRWLRPGPWGFPRLSHPRMLLRETFEAQEATVVSDTAVPHDLWPARSLPGVAPVDRVVLILTGFDLVGEPSTDGSAWRIAPIRRPCHLLRDYPDTARTAQAAAALNKVDSDVRVRREGRRLLVAARWEDHEQIRAAIRGDSSAADKNLQSASSARAPVLPRGARAQRFTLKIENQPVGRVLDQLAAKFGLTLVWADALDGATPLPGETLVSCDVREVDLDGLLEAIVAPAGLQFERDDQTVKIRAAD